MKEGVVMKKLIGLVLLVMVILTGCANKSASINKIPDAYAATNNQVKKSESRTIPFKYAFTGFVQVKDVYNDLPVGVQVFKTQEEWNKFKDKYLASANIPYAGYSGGFDFSSDYVVYYSMLDAKADFYAKAWQIDKVTLENQEIKLALKDISSNLTITASSSEKFGGQRYVIVITVNKNELKTIK